MRPPNWKERITDRIPINTLVTLCNVCCLLCWLDMMLFLRLQMFLPTMIFFILGFKIMCYGAEQENRRVI